ncbi:MULTISPECIES: sigma-70 family RNA polymerase sigma factor [Bacillus]|uniref:sigma-70 family RNA polymerase sigma factor n=1 Tax=Bacillus TaxID=1386 RepID=UPI0020A0CECE|nr:MULTISPECIES: sigma-70 family RNA polymerase sigma factor [Bacillus]MCP1160764.1 sigma-70 family RNA polymerase sigma factor [Bacillus infantis]
MNQQDIREVDLDNIITGIMKNYGTELSILAYSYVKDVEVSKDIIQNVFIKCYIHYHTFEKRSSIKTWLYRITINQCKDYLKSQYIRRMFLQNSSIKQTSYHTPETITIDKLDDEQVVAEIMSLSKKYREVLILRYIHELEAREIAEVLSVSVETVKTRIRRGKNKLLPKLREEFLYD